MTEGDQIPENKPLTPTEKSERFIRDCAHKIKSIGINSYAAGVTTMMTINNLNYDNKTNALMSGLATAFFLLLPTAEGVRLQRGITKLSEENVNLKEHKQ